jgi:thymidylate synthase
MTKPTPITDLNGAITLAATSPDSHLFRLLFLLQSEQYHGVVARTESRNGPVLRFTVPVITSWICPDQRVSFWDKRDANPFFHYMESIWMLAGRDDVAFPAYFAKQIRQFSDDGETLNGAYGYRWRFYFNEGVDDADADQLDEAIRQLKENPASRRVILQMWDPVCDPVSAANGSKDVPCNTEVMFDAVNGKLNMTVVCRSNDIIWGATGANAVHFSILHEYVTAAAGLRAGTYHQVSNNLHVYTEFPVSKPLLDATDDPTPEEQRGDYPGEALDLYAVRGNSLFPMPLFASGVTVSEGEFDAALINIDFIEALKEEYADEPEIVKENFLSYFSTLTNSVEPSSSWQLHALVLQVAFMMHRELKQTAEAIEFLKEADIGPDWKLACVNWLQRRLDAAKAKEIAA